MTVGHKITLFGIIIFLLVIFRIIDVINKNTRKLLWLEKLFYLSLLACYPQ